ncbi:serine hydrolase domain-containing protein [Streptacidiphilus sp. P02-A3a]|uniref:serine hydrolase domain-containing protein n=1 Tax=Streptacidiphilus sp. P02-A3a TaxID=2704468 RepID=UPI0015FCFAB6|nr:serine hydrolase domain-containing protein [Streptacidiphilus sp. P02-A3a]QMU68409.1 beta-lactamase family protein [Streptacidiphilus sp. P02-A3a]
MDQHTTHGTVATGFEAVREEFHAVAAAEGGDYAAQLTIYHQGKQVVDLWTGPEISGDSLTGVYSCTKGAAYLVAALLVQQGALELDQQVSYYWPEFGAAGKQHLTVRELLAHRAGVVGAVAGFTLDELADDRVLAARMAAQTPYWRPGTAFGYHALVAGALIGEVVFRATGRSIQQHFEEHIRAPYGIDFYLGLPPEQEPRFLTTQPMRPTPEQLAQVAANPVTPPALLGIAFNQKRPDAPALDTLPNHPVIRAKAPASVGGVASARGLARMYAAATTGTDGLPPLLTPDTVAAFGQIQSVGLNLVTGGHSAYGVGFTAVADLYPVLNPGSFGHPGADGSQSFADPHSGLAYGYTRRRYAFPGGAAAENTRLVRAAADAANATVPASAAT